MITLEALQQKLSQGTAQQYVSDRALNLYKTPKQEGLVTQVDVGYPMQIMEFAPDGQAVRVLACRDDYPGWISASDGATLTPATSSYESPVLSAACIEARIFRVIDFTEEAMATPNQYLWGGAVAPNYDCSGLMQAAFASVGVQLPRDSYQQEAFTERVAEADLQPGDLLFFGTPERTTHVALHLGDGRYIHSSGIDNGRNGIGIDSIYDLSYPVSQRYHKQLRCFGRVTKSYQSTGVSSL